MRKICIFNHKGGVGKTTTAINLAAGLSRKDKNVLLIDLDPQSNIGLSLRVENDKSIYDALVGKHEIAECILTIGKNLDVITSKENLTKAEYYLSNQPNSKMVLTKLLNTISGYDYVLIDCPPSLGILNQNVLAYCTEAFIPTSTDFLGFNALGKMQPILDEINKTYRHDIKITKIIPTLFDKRNKICKETLEDMKSTFNGVLSKPIRNNSKLKEAPKVGRSIFKHARSSAGAKDYGALVEEVVNMGSIRVTEEVIA